METDEAKQLYRARAGLVELANAQQKSRHGITQVLVRGAAKVTCVILLNATLVAGRAGHHPATLPSRACCTRAQQTDAADPTTAILHPVG